MLSKRFRDLHIISLLHSSVLVGEISPWLLPVWSKRHWLWAFQLLKCNSELNNLAVSDKTFLIGMHCINIFPCSTRSLRFSIMNGPLFVHEDFLQLNTITSNNIKPTLTLTMYVVKHLATWNFCKVILLETWYFTR